MKQESPENNQETKQSGEAPKDTSQEPNDADQEPKEMKCELALLDKKYDSDGHKVYKIRKAKGDDDDSEWWKLYALTETRHYRASGEFKCTRLHVNPQPLKQLLEDVIVDFPYDPVDAQQDVEFDVPAYCLFFYRGQLEEVGKERFKDDEASLGHLKLLLDWIDKVHEDAFKASKRFQGDQRPISYEHLWTIFKPGQLVYNRVQGKARAYKLRGFWYEEDNEPCLAIRVKFIDYDGEKFGTRKDSFRIPKYSGIMRCEDLNIMPLQFHQSSSDIRVQLLERGRQFQKLTGQHFLQYSGVAIKRTTDSTFERHNLTGRIVVDMKHYRHFEPCDDFDLEDLPGTEAAKRQRTLRKYNEGIDTSDETVFDELSEDDLIMTNSTVRGFAFSVKKFLEFFVENISPIRWDETCFDQLVLNPVTKKTVQAMVTMHTRRGQDQPGFDDIVEGKGKGLVMVLHGPPGVGKTLTAECVAEAVHRPLYMVSAGDLGTDSYTLEMQLGRIMDITSTWGAVLLIDEADIFLERRSLHDLRRNAMVTVFLRVLECM